MTPPVRVAIVGAGVMGSGIAQVLAEAGNPVALFDPVPSQLERATHRIQEGVALLKGSVDTTLARLSTGTDLGAAVRDADLVIEAAPEELALKRSIFRSLEELARPGAVLASNTSAIPIFRITEGLQSGARVLGTHFWQPPAMVPLVEVVQAAETAPEHVRWTTGLLEDAGLEPVHVRADIPGFVGNRLQHALKREAIALVAAGVCDAETIDTVVKRGFGARLPVIGPLEQADLSGLGLTLQIHEVLMEYLDRTPEPHPLLVEKVRRGEIGAAAGQGFRAWRPGQAEALRALVTQTLAASARARRGQLARERPRRG